MSNTLSGFIPGGQLKQTINKGSQTINQNQKTANSGSTNTQNAGNDLSNSDTGLTSPSPGSSFVNQILLPSQQTISQNQSANNASPGVFNAQSAANDIGNTNQGSLNGTVSQSEGGTQKLDQSQATNGQSGFNAFAGQSASNGLNNDNFGSTGGANLPPMTG